MIGPLPVAASTISRHPPGTIVSVQSDGLRVEWIVPDPEVKLDERGKAIVSLPGYDQGVKPGQALLPFQALLIALPPGSDPSFEIEVIRESTLRLPAPLVIGDAPVGVQQAADGSVLGGAFTPVSPPELPLIDGPVSFEPIGRVRGVSLARLTFSPALPEGDDLQLITQLAVNVQFNANFEPDTTRPFEDDPLLSEVRSVVANPQQVMSEPEVDSNREPGLSSTLAGSTAAAIEVSKTGLTSITYDDLVAIEFPVDTIDPANLHLTRAEEEIATQWQGNSDPIFEDGEQILFFAEPRFSRWSPFDVYFLSAEEEPGQRMDSRSAVPAGLAMGTAWIDSNYESNQIYTPDCFCAPIPAGRDGDRWVWDLVSLGDDPPSATYPFELTAVDPDQAAVLTLWLIGKTDLPPSPDHRVAVSINGSELGVVEWDGKESVEKVLTIPPGTLGQGENLLTLTLPGIPGVAVEAFWLDAFAIRHARQPDLATGASLLYSGEETRKAYTVSLSSTAGLRVYDVTDPDQPVHLNGMSTGSSEVTLGDPPGGSKHRYWLTSNEVILAPEDVRMISGSQPSQGSTGADYVMISPQEFIPALEPLVELRQGAGLEVAVQDVQALYDAYGEGISKPSAIEAFLSDVYTNWTPRPAYVLLVGDGTADPKRYLSSSSFTFIPPYLADVDPWAGETAADNRYVSVDGVDNLPDMFVGRLPVNDVAELETVVAKIVQYETALPEGGWQNSAVFVADDKDGGGDFPLLSNFILKKFASPPFKPQRLYFSPDETTPTQFHQELLDSWNAGSSLIMYTGHASIHQWAAEIFFHLEDVQNLANGLRLPVVLEMTCFTGSFQVPGFPTLDESLLRHPDGGAVAVWGSTGLGIATGHHWLAEGFMESVYKEGQVGLGPATLAGKLHLATTDAHPDLIDTFTLFGDPATDLVRSHYLFMPFTRN